MKLLTDLQIDTFHIKLIQSQENGVDKFYVCKTNTADQCFTMKPITKSSLFDWFAAIDYWRRDFYNSK